MSGDLIYEARSLAYAYDSAPKRLIFSELNMSLSAGEVLSILGPNGSGKSTLINCLAGVFTPVRGEVLLCGRDIASYSAREISRLVAYVPQLHVPEFSYTVVDFVVMGRAPEIGLFSRPSKDDRDIALEALSTLGIEALAEKDYTEISGGERQQVMIARAVAQRPRVILFDEPTAHLDYGNQQNTLGLIRRLSRDGYGIIMTTHNPDHVLLLGGSAAILDKDGCLEAGAAADIVTSENLLRLYETEVLVAHVDAVNRSVCLTPPPK